MIDIDYLPARVNRRDGATLITQYFFPVSPRTLERWPVTWLRINGRAVVETSELMKEAQQRVTSAMGGE